MSDPRPGALHRANASSAPPALSIVGLTKAFGDKLAVDQVDVVVPPGSFFGLVGPNGAGKTTLLTMAVGLLPPDAGTSAVFGADVWTDATTATSRLGVLPDGLAMPERLTGREVLTFIGQLRGLDPAVVADRADELLATMDLDGEERTLVIDYSTGMRKKIGLAVALLHNPGLLVLDEPFEAVDPVSAATLKALLQRFVARGGSVVLSSHVMALVEQLCDTVAVMAAGTIVTAGDVEEVRGSGSLEDAFVRLVGVDPIDDERLSWLGS
jgi:ABC-2 type transport system ATP-binding protein